MSGMIGLLEFVFVVAVLLALAIFEVLPLYREKWRAERDAPSPPEKVATRARQDQPGRNGLDKA